jgi:hypothetical protein
MLAISNKERATDNIIIFVHIPKTGGTTLCSIIEKQYRDYYDIAQLKIPLSQYLKKNDTKRLEVIRGHFSFGIHRLLPQDKHTYITILRDPIERVISAFYYIRRSKPHKLHNIVKNITLYEFVTNKRFDHQTLNKQTHMLAGKKDADLQEAKNNLKKYFSVVGITKRYEETLYVMGKKLEWKIDNYKKRKVTQNRPTVEEIPKDVIKIIRNKNQKDMKLYQFANTLLDKQLQQL